MYLIPPSLPFPSLPYTHIHPIPTGIQNIIIRQKKTSPTSRHLPHPHTRQLSHAQSDPISNVRPPPSLTSPTYCQPVRNPSPTNQPKKKKKRKEEKKRGGGEMLTQRARVLEGNITVCRLNSPLRRMKRTRRGCWGGDGEGEFSLSVFDSDGKFLGFGRKLGPD